MKQLICDECKTVKTKKGIYYVQIYPFYQGKGRTHAGCLLRRDYCGACLKKKFNIKTITELKDKVRK